MSGEEFFVNVDLNGSVEAAKAAVLAAQSYEEGTKLKLICGKYPLPLWFIIFVCGLWFCRSVVKQPHAFSTLTIRLHCWFFLPSHCFYFCKTARY